MCSVRRGEPKPPGPLNLFFIFVLSLSLDTLTSYTTESGKTEICDRRYTNGTVLHSMSSDRE